MCASQGGGRQGGKWGSREGYDVCNVTMTWGMADDRRESSAGGASYLSHGIHPGRLARGLATPSQGGQGAGRAEAVVYRQTSEQSKGEQEIRWNDKCCDRKGIRWGAPGRAQRKTGLAGEEWGISRRPQGRSKHDGRHAESSGPGGRQKSLEKLWGGTQPASGAVAYDGMLNCAAPQPLATSPRTGRLGASSAALLAPELVAATS